MESSQSAGQTAGGSQVSPGSTTSLPQLDEQSSSVRSVQPPGQQPSLSTHALMRGAVWDETGRYDVMQPGDTTTHPARSVAEDPVELS